MDEHRTERRDVLKQMTALGAVGVPIVAGLRPASLGRARRQENPG